MNTKPTIDRIIEPVASPSSPSVTFTAFAAETLMTVIQSTNAMTPAAPQGARSSHGMSRTPEIAGSTSGTPARGAGTVSTSTEKTTETIS